MVKPVTTGSKCEVYKRKIFDMIMKNEQIETILKKKHNVHPNCVLPLLVEGFKGKDEIEVWKYWFDYPNLISDSLNYDILLAGNWTYEFGETDTFILCRSKITKKLYQFFVTDDGYDSTCLQGSIFHHLAETNLSYLKTSRYASYFENFINNDNKSEITFIDLIEYLIEKVEIK